MKVRNVTGRSVLVDDQCLVRPGPDFVSVKDTDAVAALVTAGVLEVEPDKSSGAPQASSSTKATKKEGDA